MPASRWRPAVNTGKMRLYSSIRSLSFHLMTDQDQPGAKARIGASGLAFLAVTSICWGLNWPVTKHILVEWPPLSARGLTGIAGATLQLGIGCGPVALAGLLFEHPRFEALSTMGWALMAYMTVIGYCVAYFCWFATLERMSASVATIGTMSVPVIGVVASALALHEPLGIGQIAALAFTLAGVALATRS